jgi:hypothetical protein
MYIFFKINTKKVNVTVTFQASTLNILFLNIGQHAGYYNWYLFWSFPRSLQVNTGKDSVVGIAIRYGLDSPEIESR